jgi:hypothetical protein
MSREAVESILGKAVLNSQFREELFANPDEVLADYDLTAEEMTALRAIDFETMESFAGTLDERISKLGFGGALFAMIDEVAGSPEAVLGQGTTDEPELRLSSSGGIMKQKF